MTKRLFKIVFAGLLICMAAVSDVLAQDHPTQYHWGDITIHVEEEVELYIDSEFDYATSYLNFNTTWEASDGCVEVLTPGTSNRTYCVVKGIANTHGFATRVNCQLAYRTSSNSHQYQVWHGYYNVYVESNKVKVTSITLNKTSLSLQKGQKETLIATVKPDNATDKSVSWVSSDPSIATVSSNGTMTAVATGNTTIVCTANDGSGVNSSCNVTVTQPEGIELNSTNFPDENFRNALTGYAGWDGIFTEEEIKAIKTLYCHNRNIERLKGIEFFTELTYLRCERNKIKGEAMDELINCLPQGEGGSLYVYDNTLGDEENVCTKSQVAAAKEKGWIAEYKISENTYGWYSGIDDAKPESITLSSTMTVVAGQTITLIPTITPSDAVTTLTWSSDDETIATVNSEGVVTGVKKGQTFINVETDNGKTAYCKLTVTALEPDSITISPTSKTIEQGETFTATYTLTPSNAITTVTWSSDNESIATVTQEGVVTGVGVGSTFINVETANGKLAYCKLTVTAPQPTAVSIPKNATVNVGETITLTATLTPENAVTTLSWQTDDPAVATVDANGKVTGIATGLAIIKVSTANGITSNACKLTVNPPSGIEDVNADCNKNSRVFSLSGQRLAAPKKGINIVGGKKVVIR